MGTSECKEGSCTTDEVLQHSIAGDNIEFARHCNHRSTLAPLDSCFHACARMLYLMQEKKKLDLGKKIVYCTKTTDMVSSTGIIS